MKERKVFRVNYSFCSYFPIPTGLDLEDKTIVANYNVKWDILHINLTNGKSLQIESEMHEEPDLKYPDNEEGEIEEREDTPLDDDEYDKAFEKADELFKEANEEDN
jgi:hypothetical protein